MESNIIGINPEKLTNHINDIDSRIIAISKVFEEMNAAVNDSRSYSNDAIGESIRRKYDKLSSQFSTVLDNLNTIITELNACKANYAKQDTEASILFKQNNFNDGR